MNDKPIDNIKDGLSEKCPIKLSIKEGHLEDIILKNPAQFASVIRKLFATDETSLFINLFTNAVSALPNSIDHESRSDMVLQQLAETPPQDVTETRMQLQSLALYTQGMKYLSKAGEQDMMSHAEHYLKHAAKLLRLHNETVEALDKHRRGGDQKIVVQHVNVNDGGKAAIMTGNFEARGS